MQDAGLGVFLMEPVKSGTKLTEYGGEILDLKEARARRSRNEATHLRSLTIGE